MADYKTMYYHLAGRVAGAVDALEASTAALTAATATIVGLMESLKKAQQTTEDMLINTPEDDGAE